MHGRDKNPKNSWIVAANTGVPTGYEDEQMDPHLFVHAHVLSSPAELERWLRKHSDQRPR